MGREFEYKYSCTEAAFAALQADFEGLMPIEMETTYYDTFDGRLGNNHWTLRRRYENGKSVCTLKTPSPDGGRGEWEVEAPDILTALPMLVDLGAPAELMAYCAGGLVSVCGAKFLRLAKTIEISGTTLELALDRGCLMGGDKEEALCEVEVEFKAGSEETAVAFAKELAAEFGLIPETGSKYRRALALAQK